MKNENSPDIILKWYKNIVVYGVNPVSIVSGIIAYNYIDLIVNEEDLYPIGIIALLFALFVFVII